MLAKWYIDAKNKVLHTEIKGKLTPNAIIKCQGMKEKT